MGIRLADFIVTGLRARGADAELIDAKTVGLPMLDRMYKEYPQGSAPEALETVAAKIRAADAFVFVTGEYNWGVQPGLKNLTDHFLEEWFWRPAGIASYSAGRFAGARSSFIWRCVTGGNSRGGRTTGGATRRSACLPGTRLWAFCNARSTMLMVPRD